MSANVIVTDRKYFFQHSNDDDYLTNPSNFSRHLSGSVFEKVKAQFTVEVSWNVIIEDYKFINQGGGDAVILKDGANFKSNGFSIGDNIIITFVSLLDETAEITYVSENELRIKDFTGPALIDGDLPGPDWIKGNDPLTALIYNYGLPENEDPFSVVSRLTGVDQGFFINEIDNTLKTGESKGTIKGHVTGDIKAQFLGYKQDYDTQTTTLTVQEFLIEQEFRLLPNYIEGELTNIENLIAPELFAGERTIKQVLSLDFRRTLNNPNTSKKNEDQGFLGSVGWFNENFNGFPNHYSYENLTRTIQSTGLASAGIDIAEITQYSFDIVDSESKFTAGQPFVINHSYLPDETVYSVSKDNFDTTWIADSVRQTIGGTSKNGDVISNLLITLVDPSRVTVTFDVGYNNDQANRLEIGDNYHIFALVGDNPANVNDSDKVQLSIDVGEFDKNTDVPDLIDLDSFLITNLRKEQRTNYIGAVEDSIYADIRIHTDLSKGAIIESWEFATIGYNIVDNSYFVIEGNTLNSSFISIPSGGQPVDRQFIDFEGLAGFQVEDQDYNTITIKSDSFDGTNQFYDIRIAFKIPWQDNEAIDAPISFFNASKENNGLNKNASNYSNVGDYEVRFAIIAQVYTPESIGNTEYVIMNQGNDIYNYDEVIS